MKFRKKITFSITVFKILLESLVCSLPYTFSSNSYINEDIWNIIRDPEGETQNFQGNNKSPIQCKSQLKCFPKYNYIKDIENTSSEKGENDFIIPPEFSSAPNYRELSNFPEVEYPLSVTEMWKPNYWNTYTTDYINKNMDCVNSKVKSMPKFETKCNPGRFSTKSYSDSRKNVGSLKNKGLNDFKNVSFHSNNTCNKNEIIPLGNPKLCNLDTIVPPYSVKNVSTCDVNPGVCLIDKNVLEPKSNHLTIDDVLYLTSHPEVLVAFSEICKKEVESKFKTMADNIISTNLEYTKNKGIEALNDNWKLNLTFINDVVEKFDKEMNLIIKSGADNIRNDFDLTRKINPDIYFKPVISCKEKTTSTTQSPKIPDFSSNTKYFKTNTTEATYKESNKLINVKNDNKTCPSFNDLSSNTISVNDVTCKKEKSDLCKSEGNINNEKVKEDGMLIPAHDTETQDIVQSASDSSNNEISIEEDFTTDSYPENSDWSYALSTVAPQMSNVDTNWRDTVVIEPDKCLSYPDELEQYFLLSSD